MKALSGRTVGRCRMSSVRGGVVALVPVAVDAPVRTSDRRAQEDRLSTRSARETNTRGHGHLRRSNRSEPPVPGRSWGQRTGVRRRLKRAHPREERVTCGQWARSRSVGDQTRRCLRRVSHARRSWPEGRKSPARFAAADVGAPWQALNLWEALQPSRPPAAHEHTFLSTTWLPSSTVSFLR